VTKKMRADLETASKRLNQKSLNLVVVKNGKVLFETESHGLNDLVEAINQLQSSMKGSSVADRIVGRAAALLFVYSGVSAVFAATISDGGIEILSNNNVFHEFENRVPRILNLKKTDVCPFEKLVAELSSPEEAYERLKARCA
jgi:hypothetical protein